MKKLAAIAVLALSTGCGLLPPAQGNGDVKGDGRQVPAFGSVSNGTSLPVTVDEGDTQAVVVTLDANLQGMVITTVTNDTLFIEATGGLAPSSDTGVHVTVPELKGASNTGSGSVSVGGLKQPRALILFDSGAGPLFFQGQALAIAATEAGSGGMRLSGSATGLKAELSGSGFLDARELVVNGAASLTNSGDGNLTATVNGDVSFNLSGNGNIDWFGTANVSDSQDTGSGTITHH